MNLSISLPIAKMPPSLNPAVLALEQTLPQAARVTLRICLCPFRRLSGDTAKFASLRQGAHLYTRGPLQSLEKLGNGTVPHVYDDTLSANVPALLDRAGFK